MGLDSARAQSLDGWILRLSVILVGSRSIQIRRYPHFRVLLSREIGQIAENHVFDVSVLGAKVKSSSLSRIPCQGVNIARGVIRWPDLADEGQCNRVPQLI